MTIRRPVLTALAVSVAVGASSIGLAAPAQAAATSITVDLSSSSGAIRYGANGFLYGLGSDGVPTDTMLNGLSHLGVAAQKAPDGLQHPTGDALKVAPQWKRNGGGDIQIYMQDALRNFPYDNPGIAAYGDNVATQVRKVMADPNRASFVYVPFNEPDGNWYGSNTTAFQNDWKTIYQRIRSIDPNARIAGPNYSAYNADYYRSFMTFAKANNVLPDVVTWHELDNRFFTSWYDHYNDYRKIETDLGISTRPIVINEYGRASGDLTVPGNLLQYISRFENSRVDASMAYWQPAGTLDELTTQNNRATGAWWLYNWYGLMFGNLAKVTLADQNQSTQALATYDAGAKQARILLGGNTDASANYDATVNVTGLGSGPFASKAHVTVYGVDASGTNPSTGPYIVQENDVTASSGRLTLPLTGLKGSSAYYAIVTPATSTGTVNGRYEAEYARSANFATASFGGNTGYSGTGYVQGFTNSANAATSFFVNAPSNGFYNVGIRYSAGPLSGAPANRSVKLTLNQQAVKNVTLPGTADWNTWATATVRLYLPAGINHINLAAYTSDNSDAVNLDYVQLAATTGPGTTYEAEAAGNTLAGAAAVSSDGNASGGKLVGFIGNGSGNTLQFNNVSASAAGDYTLTFAYANNETTDNNAYQIVDRFADVSINGGTPSRVAFANTRNWSTFWTASVRVTLAAGNNTIKVGNASAYAPNIDALTVAPTSN